MTTVSPPDPVHTGPDVLVWAARRRTGIDFHARAPYADVTDCGRGMGSPGSITLPLAEAVADGMRPCPRCWPLGLPTPATPADAPSPVDPEADGALAAVNELVDEHLATLRDYRPDLHPAERIEALATSLIEVYRRRTGVDCIYHLAALSATCLLRLANQQQASA